MLTFCRQCVLIVLILFTAVLVESKYILVKLDGVNRHPPTKTRPYRSFREPQHLIFQPYQKYAAFRQARVPDQNTFVENGADFVDKTISGVPLSLHQPSVDKINQYWSPAAPENEIEGAPKPKWTEDNQEDDKAARIVFGNYQNKNQYPGSDPVPKSIQKANLLLNSDETNDQDQAERPSEKKNKRTSYQELERASGIEDRPDKKYKSNSEEKGPKKEDKQKLIGLFRTLQTSSVATLGKNEPKLPCSAYKTGLAKAKGNEICYEDSPTARAYSDEGIEMPLPPPPPPPPPPSIQTEIRSREPCYENSGTARAYSVEVEKDVRPHQGVYRSGKICDGPSGSPILVATMAGPNLNEVRDKGESSTSPRAYRSFKPAPEEIHSRFSQPLSSDSKPGSRSSELNNHHLDFEEPAQHQPRLQKHGSPDRDGLFPPPIDLKPFNGPPLFLPGLIGSSTAPKVFIGQPKAKLVSPGPGFYRTLNRQTSIYPKATFVHPNYRDVYPKFSIGKADAQKAIPMSLVSGPKFQLVDNSQILNQTPGPAVNPFVGLSAFPAKRMSQTSQEESGGPKRLPSKDEDTRDTIDGVHFDRPWRMSGGKNVEEVTEQPNIKDQESSFEESPKKPNHHNASQNIPKKSQHTGKGKPIESNPMQGKGTPEKPELVEKPANGDSASSKGVEKSTIKDNTLEVLNGYKSEVNSEKNATSLENQERVTGAESTQKHPETKNETKPENDKEKVKKGELKGNEKKKEDKGVKGDVEIDKGEKVKEDKIEPVEENKDKEENKLDKEKDKNKETDQNKEKDKNKESSGGMEAVNEESDKENNKEETDNENNKEETDDENNKEETEKENNKKETDNESNKEQKELDKDKGEEQDKEKKVSSNKDQGKDGEKVKESNTPKGKEDGGNTETDGVKDKEKDGVKDKETDGEKDKETDGEKDKETDGEKNKETDGEKNKETDGVKDKETDGEKDKETDGEKNKETDGVKDKETDGVKDKETDGVKDKATDGEKDKATDGEKNKETDGEKDKETDGEKDKETHEEKNKETDGEKDKKEHKDKEKVKEKVQAGDKDKEEEEKEKEKEDEKDREKEDKKEKEKDQEEDKEEEKEDKKEKEKDQEEDKEEEKEKSEKEDSTESPKDEGENDSKQENSTDTEKKATKKTGNYRTLMISNQGKNGGDSNDVDYTKDKDVVAKDMVPDEANNMEKQAEMEKALDEKVEKEIQQELERETNRAGKVATKTDSNVDDQNSKTSQDHAQEGTKQPGHLKAGFRTLKLPNDNADKKESEWQAPKENTTEQNTQVPIHSKNSAEKSKIQSVDDEEGELNIISKAKENPKNSPKPDEDLEKTVVKKTVSFTP